jgi:hypothetical protein
VDSSEAQPQAEAAAEEPSEGSDDSTDT